jgi:hypothetical protein
MTTRCDSTLNKPKGALYHITISLDTLDGCKPHRNEKMSRSAAINASSTPADPELLKVAFGQRTFDAEGQEASGRYFSRAISWPRLGNSGVTIGRGYDMGQRTAPQIFRELTAAGLGDADATFLSRAARHRGAHAGAFVAKYGSIAPVISLEVQKNLFEKITTPEMINDIKRIFSKSDTVKAYGEASWDSLSQAAKELIFDLRYRGDYTTTTRKVLQPLLVNQDYKGLKEVMNDTDYWKTLRVPPARIAERQALAREL